MQKIAVIIPTFPKLSETFIVSKFLGLLENGLDIYIICNTCDSKEWENFVQLQKEKKIRRRIYIIPSIEPLFLVPLRWFLILSKCLIKRPIKTAVYLFRSISTLGIERAFKNFYFDSPVILIDPSIIHLEFGALAPQKMYLKDILGIKIITSFRGYDINYVGLDNPEFYKGVWEKSDAFHFLGNDLLKRACRRGFSKERPYYIIPPAIDSNFFNPEKRIHAKVLGDEDNPLRILSVGRLEWKKGYEYALQAVSLLAKEGFNLEHKIIGGGNFLEAMAFARYQLGIEKEVKFLGELFPQEVKVQMEWADIFLHTAVSEGFCNAVLEAQAMGLPVVCSNADGLSENVVDGKTGFVVPRRDPQALKEKLILLAQNPSLRQHMGESGRQRVLTYFRLGEQIGSFKQLYESLLK